MKGVKLKLPTPSGVPDTVIPALLSAVSFLPLILGTTHAGRKCAEPILSLSVLVVGRSSAEGGSRRDVLYLHFSKLSWNQGPGSGQPGGGQEVKETSGSRLERRLRGSRVAATLGPSGWLQTKRNLRVRD